MDNNCNNGQEIKAQWNNWLTAGFSVIQTLLHGSLCRGRTAHYPSSVRISIVFLWNFNVLHYKPKSIVGPFAISAKTSV